MIDFLTQNPLYVVLASALLIWIGVAWYLVRVDRSVRALEKRIRP